MAMETATTYVQNLFSGYRVPDFSGYRVPDISKLWRESDSAVDGSVQKPQVPFLLFTKTLKLLPDLGPTELVTERILILYVCFVNIHERR